MKGHVKKYKNNKKNTNYVIVIMFLFVVLGMGTMFFKYNRDINEYEMKNTHVLEERKWKRVHHDWPEPPDEDKYYTDDGFYYFKYKFDGNDFWVRASDDETKNGRVIFKNIGNLSTPSKAIEDYRVLDITGKSSNLIYEYLKSMGNRLKQKTINEGNISITEKK